MSDSKLQNNLLEQKLGIRATARNWRTINSWAKYHQISHPFTYAR
jgi:hypothetical protein